MDRNAYVMIYTKDMPQATFLTTDVHFHGDYCTFWDIDFDRPGSLMSNEIDHITTYALPDDPDQLDLF